MNIEIAIKEACKELKNNKIEKDIIDREQLLSTVIKKNRKFMSANYRTHPKNG